MSNQFPKPLFSWSFSALQMYENCPRKYWAVKIQKVDDSNKFNRQGDIEHQSIEHFMKMGMPLAEQLQGLAPLFQRIRDAPGEQYIEKLLCIDERFVPCGYKDWHNAWLRGAGDYVKVNGNKAAYFDWKSGKVKKDIEDQAELTSLLLFQHFPHVDEVKVGVLYYRYGHLQPHVVHRRDVQQLWNGYYARLQPLRDSYTNDHWPTNENPLCAWCPYKACPFNKVAQREAREAAAGAK